MLRFRLARHHERLIILAATATLLALIIWPPAASFAQTMRAVLALIFVLVMPGYLIQTALFPANNALDGLERIALTIVISLAIVPVLALLLDILPGVGIRLETILMIELFVILTAMLAAEIRRARLTEDRPYQIELAFPVAGWWSTRSNFQRVAFTLFGGLLLLGIVMTLNIVFAPREAEHFTEFFLLDADQLSEVFPTRIHAGQVISVTVGINSYEADEQAYELAITTDNRVLYSARLTLTPGEKRKIPVNFSLEQPGDNHQVTFTLYRAGETHSYRSLHLWFDVA